MYSVHHVKARETIPEKSPRPIDPDVRLKKETSNNDEAITEGKQQRSVRIRKPPSRLIEEFVILSV